MTRILLTIGLTLAAAAGGSTARSETLSPEMQAITKTQRDQAIANLREALERETGWVKVHAAEHLLDLSYTQGIYPAFDAEREQHESQPKYRIGIWRVLARSAPTPAQREDWINRIRAVVLDPAATDRTHAVETLAKLRDRLETASLRKAVAELLQSEPSSAPYARWLLAHVGGAKELSQLAELLEAEDPAARLVAAYALERLRPEDPRIREKLRQAADREPVDSPAREYLLSAAWVLAENEQVAESYRKSLLEMGESGTASSKSVASDALAERGKGNDVGLLERWLNDADADVRAAASAALLRIDRRATHRLAWLDWGVVGLYFVSMLAIGWFYSLRTHTTDEYLLGGRAMKPWAVGISLFATLCSTISYLSTPGEMIQHGPMYFSSLLALPVVNAVIGWWLIPCFMKLRMTSAYEILETRLGLGVRLLGATFFLVMRLLWMAVILDVTVNVVLLPLLALDRSWGPYLCALLGLTTVIYSTMGGFRAVVTTDVVQSFILLGGAMAALGLITWHLGGVGGWWPTEWASNWDPISLGFDPSSRMSLSGVLIATFFWYLCTAGSDQMAIQRYLATRDLQSARRMFSISMVAGVIVTILLALLGLGLLSWFRLHPEMLGEGQSLAQNADQLFPRYIVAGLPAGVSGLVVAGLLAAAMSSLSSGLSSSCSVIAVDFLDRFGQRKLSNAEDVRRARIVSWSVGVAVVLLSAVVGLVQGNVLEIAFKVVNLLVAPLFGLFFMALFVRWATSFGTFVGAAFGVATVVLISYWTELTGGTGISFLWSMPVGLFVQVAVGSVFSLVPIGVPVSQRATEAV